MISVIIPTYKSPDALDLCLKSAIEGQQDRKNQIIVVVDGFYDINKEVLEKYAQSIDVLDLKTNLGACKAINLGVYNAKYELVLIVNDDNVFPFGWDNLLNENYQPNTVISPNQIEPSPSMFSQFVIEDLGRDPKTFDLKAFWRYEMNLVVDSENEIDETGSTFPIFMNKYDYIRIGGFDESYPSTSGVVSDWDFFLKCQLSKLKMLRTYECYFYHFVSLSAKLPEQVNIARQNEIEGHEYAKYKWGSYIKHDPLDNSKYI